MLKLKAVNLEDAEKEYAYISNLPADECGFTNPDFGCTKEEFMNAVLPRFLDNAEGNNLKEGYVPCTEYFLWDDDTIVGLFRIRHYLNAFLENGAGHIGYGIAKEFRGKGYGKKGLAMIIEEAKKIIPEEEIYMSVNKDNPASLAVQKANGAYIHHEDEKEFYTRIPLK